MDDSVHIATALASSFDFSSSPSRLSRQPTRRFHHRDVPVHGRHGDDPDLHASVDPLRPLHGALCHRSGGHHVQHAAAMDDTGHLLTSR